jgi:DNA invertase Pin-like site-specific DNA recombinase
MRLPEDGLWQVPSNRDTSPGVTPRRASLCLYGNSHQESYEKRQALKCDLYLHQQAIDTTTPSGRAMFQMCGVFAEFERAMIVERINAGLARAREKGSKLGRRPVKPEVEARIRELRAQGMGMIKIGRTIGVGTSVVQRVLQPAS